PSAIDCLAGIKLLDELLARVEFFCQKLRHVPIAQRMKVGYAFKIAWYLRINGPRTSSSVTAYSIRTSTLVDSHSLSHVAWSSLPLTARPRKRWNAPIAFPVFSPTFPSTTPGDRSSLSSSTSALTIAALVILGADASEHAA